MYTENELYHHGVKGMKWGVRKNRNSAGRNSGVKRKTKRHQSANSKKVASRKKDYKNRRTMSDKELQQKIERLKMEKTFKELTKEDISPGRNYAQQILAAAGKKTLTVAAAGAMAYGVKVAMTKEFNIKEAAAYVAANPNKKK